MLRISLFAIISAAWLLASGCTYDAPVLDEAGELALSTSEAAVVAEPRPIVRPLSALAGGGAGDELGRFFAAASAPASSPVPIAASPVRTNLSPVGGPCSVSCDCNPSLKCEAGRCISPAQFGPFPPGPFCYGDCQCGAGTLCIGQFVAGAGFCSLPTLEYSSDDGSKCGNFGFAHPSPGFLLKETIIGPPGAPVTKFNRHLSCGGGAVWWQDPAYNGRVIPPDGKLVIFHPSSSPFSCSEPVFGQWEGAVLIRGVFSDLNNTARFTYFNSNPLCAAGVQSCGAAQGFCPGRACNGPGCP